jgi:hypothetical protein
VAILGIDGNEVGLGQVGIAVRKIGAGMVNIVRHPREGRRPVELNVAILEGKLFFTDFQSVTEDIRAIRPGRDQAREELP